MLKIKRSKSSNHSKTGPDTGCRRKKRYLPIVFIRSKFVKIYITLLLLNFLIIGSNGEKRSPRVVETKQGKLRGIIRSLPNKILKPVEVFLGVPYATPPIGTNRFSPTRTPSPWEGERDANRYKPVCPQLLPNLSQPTSPRNRLISARKLANHLTNQAEDCLYLNIFVPAQVVDTVRHKAFPVLVYIHGDSYEYGAANPYDGSVLSAYGDVIVVTLNYRLGPLGFLNTNADSSNKGHVMNHGLMDQIAALHWVHENIGAFGGDPGSVTLMGHGTGAACVHFLMASAAVVPGLFHRAILMSGSAFSPWASVGSPTYYGMQFARALNCSSSLPKVSSKEIPTNEQFDEMVNCLKDRSLEELQSVKLGAPRFLYSFGPSVDGIVIKNDFKQPIRNKPEDQRKEYDILFGVVPNESYDYLSEKDLIKGFDNKKRDKILRTLIRNSFDYHLNEVFISAVNEYTDWEHPHVTPKLIRDSTLDALGDALYVSPLLQSVSALSGGRLQQYFYVFDHMPGNINMPGEMKGTIHGEELAYLFGAPLVGELGLFQHNWTLQDVIASEAVLTYFTNFARTGNPNLLSEQELKLNSRYTSRFSAVKWEPYDDENQRFLAIGDSVQAKSHYRANSLAVWTWLIPQLQAVGKDEFLSFRSPGIMPITNTNNNKSFDAKERVQEISVLHHLFLTHDDPNLYIGSVRPLRHMAGHYVLPPTTTTEIPDTSFMPQPPPPPIQPLSTDVHYNRTAYAEATMPQGAVDYVTYSTALSVTVAIGVSILILNILIIAGVYYRRDRARMGGKINQQTRFSSTSSSEHQMIPITGSGTSMIDSSSGLDVIAKTHSKPITISGNSIHSPLTKPHSFPHISECPPEFADTLVTFTSEHQSILPHTTAHNLNNGGIIGQNILNPHSAPRMPSQVQAMLPSNIPSPPRGKIPACDEFRV